MVRTLIRAAFSIVLLTIAVVANADQSASITALVRGPKDEPVPDAVAVISAARPQRIACDAQGRFTVSVAPGTYDVLVYSALHEPWCFTSLRLESGQAARFDIHLKPFEGNQHVYFDEPGPDDLIDDNRVLTAMREASLCSDVTSVPADSYRYRFLWKRRFHPAVVATLTIASDGAASGRYKEASGTSSDPGELRVDQKIDVEKVNETPGEAPSSVRGTLFAIGEDLQKTVAGLPYRSEDGSITVDGAGWTLEAIANQRCRVMHRWSPGPDDDVRRAAELLLHLLNVRFYYDEVY
jgi:hypothetical protein